MNAFLFTLSLITTCFLTNVFSRLTKQFPNAIHTGSHNLLHAHDFLSDCLLVILAKSCMTLPSHEPEELLSLTVQIFFFKFNCFVLKDTMTPEMMEDSNGVCHIVEEREGDVQIQYSRPHARDSINSRPDWSNGNCIFYCMYLINSSSFITSLVRFLCIKDQLLMEDEFMAYSFLC